MSCANTTESDRPQLIELIRELQQFESALFDRLKPSEDIGGWYVDNILADCAKCDGTILVATRNGGLLLGYAVLHANQTSKKYPDEIDYTYAHIEELAVTEPERGTGLGRRLLSKCEEIARASGAPWLRIGVLSNNVRAQRMYEKFGFAPLYQRLEKPLT